MISINGEKALKDMLANSMGLPEYKYILEHYRETDITMDDDFQRTFNHFYRVRRNEKWRERYYMIFESYKRYQKEITFKSILDNIYDSTGTIEASFASKMLATFDTSKPIWDSKVLSALNIKVVGKTVTEKKESVINNYERLEEWYLEYLKSEEAKKNIEIFDGMLSDFSWISSTKKIDYMLWITG